MARGLPPKHTRPTWLEVTLNQDHQILWLMNSARRLPSSSRRNTYCTEILSFQLLPSCSIAWETNAPQSTKTSASPRQPRAAAGNTPGPNSLALLCTQHRRWKTSFQLNAQTLIKKGNHSFGPVCLPTSFSETTRQDCPEG